MYCKIIKSVCFKPIVALLVCAVLFMSFTLPAETVIIKSGTVIPMELMTTLSSKTARTGQMVDFRVTNDVKVNGKVVIAAGSIAQGQVVRSQKNGLMGKEGELEISVKTIRAVDGTIVYLSNNSLTDEGNGKLAISIVFTVLCLFGFLIKGGNAEIPAGAQVQAFVGADTEIQLN